MRNIILTELNNMNKRVRRAKKFHSIKYNNFKYETQYETFGHKVDEFSLIYCQDWFVDPSPEYYGKDFILWDQIPLKYLKVPKNTDYTYWMGWITFKDTDKWLYREDAMCGGEEKWVWREGDRPSLNKDTTMEFIEIDA